MNFYPHHIGDFNNSTRHLTRVERSVYRDAIELYYDTECALTRDIDKLCRKLLCVSDEEKNALNAVLDEFFLCTDDGYTHERCDIEIAKYRSNTNAKARAGIASAAKRKQNSTGVQQNSTGVHNQEPLTNNQEPIEKPLSGKPDDAPKKSTEKKPTPEAQEVLTYLNGVVGSSFEPVPANIDLIVARLREGATVEKLRGVIDRKFREWSTDGNMRKYLRPATLFNKTKYAQYAGEAGTVKTENPEIQRLIEKHGTLKRLPDGRYVAPNGQQYAADGSGGLCL